MKQITLSLIALVLFAFNLTGQETKAVDLMSKALYEENINADYTKASQIYQQVLNDFSQDKKACGQATYRLGLCAEKLGQVKAQEYFVSVVENFSDQPELVNLARAKLNNSEKLQFFTDKRDGRNYKYVNIGRLDWMTENLAYMPHVSTVDEQGGIWVANFNGNEVEEAKVTDNYQNYGCLYDWLTAMKSCPVGWHLPSDEEWSDMERYFGAGIPVSNALDINEPYQKDHFAEFTNDLWPLKNYTNNISQLSIMPAGFRMQNLRKKGTFALVDGGTAFWTSSKDSLGNIRNRQLGSWLSGISLQKSCSEMNRGYSVRCVRNHLFEQADTVPPKLFAQEPASGTKLIGIVSVSVIIKDNSWMDYVKFIARFEGHDSLMAINRSQEEFGFRSTTYTLDWDTRVFPDGVYQLTSIAFDLAGNSREFSSEYRIMNKVPELQTDGTLLDARDGKVYRTVKIGDQEWMGQNLNYRFQENSGSFCYQRRESNCDVYGRLYTFAAANQVCPTGWTLPSDEDWKTMEIYLGMDGRRINDPDYRDSCDVGDKLKSIPGWFKVKNYSTNKTSVFEGNNSSGFNALPGGEVEKKYYGYIGESVTFWTSTMNGSYQAWSRSFWGFSKGIMRSSRDVSQGAVSVRCIKDTSPTKN